MENEQINLTIENGQKELTILHGKAQEPIILGFVNVNGAIDAPLKYLKVREPDLMESNIQVNRDAMSIQLTVNERLKNPDIITGTLKFTGDFEKWGINTGTSRSSRDLSEFIKMNRSAFTSKETAMKLSDILGDLKIKVEKVIEAKDDHKGNVRILRQQAVKELNIPNTFKVDLQIFKSGPKVQFEIEIYIDADNFNCSLVSPDVADVIRETRDNEIDKVINEIIVLKPGLAIMEV